MRAEVAIAKVGKDNNIDMAEEMDFFKFTNGEKSVQLDGFYGIKDLKLFIEVLQFMEAE
jgi:hypothetical protein